MYHFIHRLWISILLTAVCACGAHADMKQLWNWASEQHGHIKHWIRQSMADPIAKKGLDTAAPATVLIGVDFDTRTWSANEYTNQLGHMFVGELTRDFFGRTSALVVAVGVEVEQYFVNDHHQLKLADRLRDISSYVFP